MHQRIRNLARFLTLACSCFVALFTSLPLWADQQARFVLIEAPASQRMAVYEIALSSGETNVLDANDSLVFSGNGYRGREITFRNEHRLDERSRRRRPPDDAVADGCGVSCDAESRGRSRETTFLPGLNWELVENADWFSLFSHLHRSQVLPATSRGTNEKLLNVSMRETEGLFGLRQTGYLRILTEGVWKRGWVIYP